MEDFFYFYKKKTVIFSELLFCFAKIRKLLNFTHHHRVFELSLLHHFWSLWRNQGMKKHLKHAILNKTKKEQVFKKRSKKGGGKQTNSKQKKRII
jgi:hypothetical protein